MSQLRLPTLESYDHPYLYLRWDFIYFTDVAERADI
jgi:hypothetical protein